MRKKCAVVLGMFGLVAIISGCGAQNNNQSNDNQAESYDIYVDVDFDSNILFNTYDVNVFIDEEEIGYIEHGEYYTYETSILEGTHSIRFCKSGDSSVYGEASFEITDDSTLKCSIAAEGDSVNIQNFAIMNADIGHIAPKMTLINGSYAHVSFANGKGTIDQFLK